MGHYYSGMLDIYSDLTQQSAYFGGHIEILRWKNLLLSVAKSRRRRCEAAWLNSNPPWTCSPIARRRTGARSLHSVALDALVYKHNLGSSRTIIREPAILRRECHQFDHSWHQSADRQRNSRAGEYEIKNAQA